MGGEGGCPQLICYLIARKKLLPDGIVSTLVGIQARRITMPYIDLCAF